MALTESMDMLVYELFDVVRDEKKCKLSLHRTIPEIELDNRLGVIISLRGSSDGLFLFVLDLTKFVIRVLNSLEETLNEPLQNQIRQDRA